MPVTAGRRASASPNDHNTAAGGPSSRPARPRICPEDAGIVDVEVLVGGYLSAVAAALHERGIAAATVALHGPARPGEARRGLGAGVLSGTLNLRPTGTGPMRWGPTQVDWHPDTGWSARLRRGINGHLIIWRYLHAALVPPPAVAVGFIAALGTPDDIGQPTPAVFGDRRRKILTQLGRFAVREPW